MTGTTEGGATRSPAPVVVGVDGSAGSARALAWALREALDREAPLRVVTAWAWNGSAGAAGRAGVSTARQARQNQEALVRAVLARFPGRLPSLTLELLQGDAASVLIDRSTDGDLLVLGTRGLGEGEDAVVGSVADACLRSGSCPVVVVPAPDVPEQRPSAENGARSGLPAAVLGAVGLL